MNSYSIVANSHRGDRSRCDLLWCRQPIDQPIRISR